MSTNKLIPIINSEYIAGSNAELDSIIKSFGELMYLHKESNRFSEERYFIYSGKYDPDSKTVKKDQILRSSPTGLVDFIEGDESMLSVDDVTRLIQLIAPEYKGKIGHLTDRMYYLTFIELQQLGAEISRSSIISTPSFIKLLDEVQSNKFTYLNHINLVTPGNISNYVSITNSTSTYQIDNIGNLSMEYKSQFTLQNDNENVYGNDLAGDILAYEYDRYGNLIGDPNIYVLPEEKITITKEILSEGDLVDITIVYHKDSTLDISEDIDYNEVNDCYTIIDSDINFLATQEINRVFASDSEYVNIEKVENNVQFNGQSITVGDNNELVKKLRFIVKPGIINISGFTIQISNENIVIYSTNPVITEYYIKSLIKIETH